MRLRIGRLPDDCRDWISVVHMRLGDVDSESKVTPRVGFETVKHYASGVRLVSKLTSSVSQIQCLSKKDIDVKAIIKRIEIDGGWIVAVNNADVAWISDWTSPRFALLGATIHGRAIAPSDGWRAQLPVPSF